MPIFIVDNNRGLNAPITLSKEDEHHLVRVMRVHAGETLFVTDNCGSRSTILIESVKPLELKVLSREKIPPPKPITLALPMIDQDRLEWAIEKLTEVNCAKIILTTTERTQKKSLAETKLTRLKKIAESAQKQCGRCWPVEITGPRTLPEVIKSQTTSAFFVADLVDGMAHSKDGLSRLEDGRPQRAAPTQNQSTIIFVGPEGGFTDAERKLFLEHRTQFINLGDTILRTETAAIIAFATI